MPDSGKGQDSAVRVAALSALYQAERSENVTLLSTNIALLGAVLAYAAASVAFLDQLAKLPRLAAALVPSPVWLGMLYSTLLVALAGRRGASALLVEKELLAHTGIRSDDRDRVGSRAGEYIVNPRAAPWPYKIVLGLVYTVPWGLVILYTWRLLVHYVVAGRMLYIAETGYGLVFLAVITAYIRAFRDTPDLSQRQPGSTGSRRGRPQRGARNPQSR